jgi:ankyrin repeat protein
MYGRCDVVKCLLSSDADINLCDDRGLSPLFIASKYGRCDVVKCLLSSGADINLCDVGGQSPLNIALCKGETNVVWRFFPDIVRNFFPNEVQKLHQK